MSDTDDDRNRDDDVNQATTDHARRRRIQIAAGAAGLAAVLGAGAYFVTGTTTDTADVGALAPVATTSETVTAGASVTASTTVSASPSATPSSSAPTIAPEVRKSIDAARKKMAEDGVPVKRPIETKVAAQSGEIDRKTTGSLDSGGIVRIVSARTNLTGQGELAYVAGGIALHRGVPCSQTFHFSNNDKPAKKPNLLMCWRITDTKSVAAIVVDPEGHPSRDKAVDTLEKAWNEMK